VRCISRCTPLSPIDEGEASIGFDLGSSPERLAALQRSLQSGTFSVSQRVTLLDTMESGFLAFKPLFIDNEVPASGTPPLSRLRGFVEGVFNLSDIFGQVLASMPQQAIDYRLRDLQATEGTGVLLDHHHEAAAGAGVASGWQPEPLAQRLRIADREWELVTTPASGYMRGLQADSAWFILSVGLLLAFILASYLIELARSSERIKATESERLSLENQLFRSQKMEAIGRLVGGIAHDFNNLLTSIMGYAELALYEKDPRRNEEYLQLIQQGGEKGRSLIGKLLSFSRNEPAQLAPVQLPPLVENTISMLKPVMPPRIDIGFSCDGDLPPACIDATSLDQVLVNLCINARDAIEHRGSIHISVQRSPVQQACCSSCSGQFGGDHVVLCVQDTGCGIPQEALGRIFKPFYTTKEAGKGTGLGLSIIHNVVHICRGHVQVESRPGQATQFRLYLPVAGETGQARLLQAG
jgi:signal transduction histidine kinase